MDQPNNAPRSLHPIGTVADRTGLSVDVLRIWERRYGAVEPSRDEAGRRLYSDEDIEKLRLLAQVTGAGQAIGQVASLGLDELRELVRGTEAAEWTTTRPATERTESTALVAEAMKLTRALDGAGVEHVLRRAASVLGTPAFLEEVVVRLTQQIGRAWIEGSVTVAQEHLASGVLRGLLSQLRAGLPVRPGAPALVVATPVGERHEIGALLVAAAAAVEGWRVTYLGADLPAAEIARAAVDTNARAVALSAIYVTDAGPVAAEVRALRSSLPRDVVVLLGGAGSGKLREQVPDGDVVHIEDLPGLRAFLREGAFLRDLSFEVEPSSRL